MGEPIRRYIKKRVLWAWGIGAGAWLVVMLTGVVGTSSNAHQAIILGFVLVIGAAIAVRFIKCPKCSTKLGQTVAAHIAMPLGRPRFNHCPYCGVSLDGPRPDAPSAPSGSQNPLNPIK